MFLDFVFFCLWGVCMFISWSNILLGWFKIEIFLPTFAIFFLRKKWRERHLFGRRAIYCYLQSSIFMAIGISVYLILCNCEWFRSCLSYTDLEYQVADFYLYPEAEYIIQLADDTFAFAIILIIPYLVYSFFNICKTSYSKIQNMHHEG